MHSDHTRRIGHVARALVFSTSNAWVSAIVVESFMHRYCEGALCRFVECVGAPWLVVLIPLAVASAVAAEHGLLLILKATDRNSERES
jgi:hypothetical protein